MLFRVKNLGLIDEAEIKLAGITVITGKSTIGRMLYCVNNVFLRDKVRKTKIYRIERVVANTFGEQHQLLNLVETIAKTIVDDEAKFLADECFLKEFLTSFKAKSLLMASW